MRVSLIFRVAAFFLLLVLWTVLAVAARAEDTAAPAPPSQQGAVGDGISGTPRQTDIDALRSFRPTPPGAAAKPAAPPEADAAKPDAAALHAAINDCVDESGDFATIGKRYGFVATLANKCEKRLKCVVDAYITGAKGPASGHGTLILAPKSQGDAAKKSLIIRVKALGGTAEMSADCKAL